MLRTALVSLAAACLLAHPVWAQSARPRSDQAVIEAARSYLVAYGDLDTDALAQIYADDAVFIDETSRIMPAPFIWHGRDQILEQLAKWRADSVNHIGYDVTSVFEAAGRVVFIGHVVTDLDGPNGPVRYRFPIVTIVTMTEGRVAEHRDYVDYHSARPVE